MKGTVVPPIVERAAGLLVTGTLARDSMIARGAHPERVRVFANTIDVEDFGEQADRLAGTQAGASRARSGRSPRTSSCCRSRGSRRRRASTCSSRPSPLRTTRVSCSSSPAKGLSALASSELAGELSVRLTLAGDVDWERIVELYVAADVFALLSEREPWAVVVNEAAACGLPLVLSDRVGAAHDLLRDGENGALVRSRRRRCGGAVACASSPRDPELRRAQGARSRELARDWGYGPSVEGFLDAVREAVADRR